MKDVSLNGQAGVAAGQPESAAYPKWAGGAIRSFPQILDQKDYRGEIVLFPGYPRGQPQAIFSPGAVYVLKSELFFLDIGGGPFLLSAAQNTCSRKNDKNNKVISRHISFSIHAGC
jgi:hypothetical protein